MKLSKKNITKLLDSEYRSKILSMISEEQQIKLMIPQYARYVVDSQIISRAEQFKNDKNAYYGFSPISFLCAVMSNGLIDKKLFEFNIVNHFLKDTDGNSAVDVVKCILIMWKKEQKDIVDFNVEKIDAELVRLDEEFAKQKTEDNVKAKETTEHSGN